MIRYAEAEFPITVAVTSPNRRLSGRCPLMFYLRFATLQLVQLLISLEKGRR